MTMTEIEEMGENEETIHAQKAHIRALTAEIDRLRAKVDAGDKMAVTLETIIHGVHDGEYRRLPNGVECRLLSKTALSAYREAGQ